MKKYWLLLVLLLLVVAGGAHAQATDPQPTLWVRAQDLPRLRAWASPDNVLYSEGLAILAQEAIAAMDTGIIPAQDMGSTAYEEYPTESTALLFAFMSLIAPDEAARQDYASRARTLLMHIMDQAVLGVAEAPFRSPDFAISDRSRWYGANFGLTVNWIYPTLTAADKATIRTVFLRWCAENQVAATTNYNHPEPVGVVNDPILISDRTAVRWASNNYYAAHMRNMGLMALSFAPEDDPDGALGAYASNASGAWLYVIDHLLRTDAAGGLGVEGFEYSPQSLGYTAQFLLALHTAGRSDPAVWGQQVSIDGNPFWRDSVTAYLNSLTPTPVLNADYGQMVYQPAWYGSAQNYWMPDMIEVFGALGTVAQLEGDAATLNALRWIQTYTAPGLEGELADRLRDSDSMHKAILYFLLFDPTASPPTDPRPTVPTAWYAPGVRRLLARTDWSADAAFFSYNLTWNEVDHQSAGGNAIEFYRGGEWLTKIRTGYDFDYHTSDNLNTLTVANRLPSHDDFRLMIGQRGSQWLYSAGEPTPPLTSIADLYVYAQGDATPLYNSVYEGVTDVTHVSRSVVWLKPDGIVVYDRAATQAPSPAIRFWLNFPNDATVNGTVTTMTTASGQTLTTQTVLPVGAQITVSPLVDEVSSAPANLEPMRYRLQVTAPEGEGTARFLHVLQGTDAGTAPQAVSVIDSEGVQGVTLGTMAIVFPVEMNAGAGGYSYFASVPEHILTGLTPGAGYTVSFVPSAEGLQVVVTPGGSFIADSGGVIYTAFE